MASNIVQLDPAADVDRVGGQFLARSATPWLRLQLAEGVPVGRWIKLTYRGSYFDPLVRPILRFVTDDGTQDELAPAPLFGRTHWIGRVPDAALDILISPVNRPGPFGFEIESCRPTSWAALIAAAWANDRRRTLEAIGAFCIGRRRDAQRLMGAAARSFTFDRYHEWRRARRREIDRDGLDAPRSDWSRGPHIRFVTAAGPDDTAAIKTLHDTLMRQSYDRWSLALITADPMALGGNLGASLSGRTRLSGADEALDALLHDIGGEDLLCAIAPGDQLPPEALAVVAEHAAAQPDATVFYGDEDAIDATGRHVAPQLKPDWSPIFEAAAGYVGLAPFVRCRLLAPWGAIRLGDFAVGQGWRRLLAASAANTIAHIRRVVLTRPATFMAIRGQPMAPPPANGALTKRPCATIIIPNKDRPSLLSTCLHSLERTEGIANAEIVVVDNGSTDPKILHIYETLTAAGRIRVLNRPGPFNFALQCNEAAEEARAPLLVFLNNDIEIIDRDWLQPLLSWAAQTDVGAVGAQLLYPSRRLQHCGIVLGLGGTTGHLDRGAREGVSGYLGRRTVPHEVAAVTAACMAVEKSKFDAVYGFDAVDLPVELNDIDLCLRLEAHGWRTILEPRSVLVHHESVSRGSWTTQRARHAREHAIFRARWQHVLRDDPYFHPALSLDSLRTALG